MLDRKIGGNNDDAMEALGARRSPVRTDSNADGPPLILGRRVDG